MIRIRILIPGRLLQAGLLSVLGQVPDFQVEVGHPGAPRDANLEEVWVVSGVWEQQSDLPARLGETEPAPALLVITENRSDLGGLPLLPISAWGALPVDASPEELESAVRALAAGLVVVSPVFWDATELQDFDPEERAEPDLVERLTEREAEVLQLLSRGLSNRQIAARLQISEHTAKFHVASICGKLGAANRTEAVRLGLQHGLIAL